MLVFPLLIDSYMTLVQLITDIAYMGRVMSLVTMSMSVASIISLTASGALTDHFGVRSVIAAGGAILIVSGVVGLFVIRLTPAPVGATEPRGAPVVVGERP